MNLVFSALCIVAQLAPRSFKRHLCVQKRDATVTPGVLSLTRSTLSVRMSRRLCAVISVQTVDSRGCLCFWEGVGSARASFLSILPCTSVWGIATQTEATLISVLESNLACVRNGSLYQLCGSLPCLESGCGGDASLMTAEGATEHNRLLRRPAVHTERTRRRPFMLRFCADR